MRTAATPSLETLTASPHEAFARLRSSAPVAWIDALGGWVVLDHRTATRVMHDASTFTVDDPRFTTSMVIGPSMLSLDGAEHRRQRRPFAAAIRRSSRTSATAIRAVADELIDGLRPQGAVDMRSALAGPLATQTTLDLLGLDDIDVETARSWYTEIVSAVTAASAGDVDAIQAGRRAYDALAAAVTAALHNKAGLVADAASALSIGEVSSNAAVVMFGGIETGEGAIANALWHLFGDERTAGRVQDDRSLVPRVVDESLRLEPAASRVDRYATVDVDLSGAAVRSGDLVIVSLASANRDPAVFDSPDVFDIDRPNQTDHLTFAVGPHACPGAALARTEVAGALHAVLDGLSDIRLDKAKSIGPTGLVFRKPQLLQMTWSTGWIG